MPVTASITWMMPFDAAMFVCTICASSMNAPAPVTWIVAAAPFAISNDVTDVTLAASRRPGVTTLANLDGLRDRLAAR